jgi:hypothetical protein
MQARLLSQIEPNTPSVIASEDRADQRYRVEPLEASGLRLARRFLRSYVDTARFDYTACDHSPAELEQQGVELVPSPTSCEATRTGIRLSGTCSLRSSVICRSPIRWSQCRTRPMRGNTRAGTSGPTRVSLLWTRTLRGKGGTSAREPTARRDGTPPSEHIFATTGTAPSPAQ